MKVMCVRGMIDELTWGKSCTQSMWQSHCDLRVGKTSVYLKSIIDVYGKTFLAQQVRLSEILAWV